MTFTSAETLKSVAQIAKTFGVGQLTVRRWIASGELKHIRIGSTIRIRIEDVEAFISASQARAAQ